MGVINLDDERKNKSSGYTTISELYKRNFNKYTDDIIENQRIRNIINEISQITNIDKMIGFVDKYKMLEQRNHGNEERVRLALVPDIKLAYLRGNMEIIVMEHQKQIISDGLKKNKKDTTKIAIMMHDLLTKISKDLESRSYQITSKI
nr:15412_t:CDS:2 [Entrophospora candida]